MAESEAPVEIMAESEAPVEEEVPQSWTGYSWHLLTKAGRGTLTVINYLGEKLAYAFGITTPDWQYAIDIYEDMQEEERREKEEEERALREQEREMLERLRELENQRTSRERES